MSLEEVIKENTKAVEALTKALENFELPEVKNETTTNTKPEKETKPEPQAKKRGRPKKEEVKEEPKEPEPSEDNTSLFEEPEEEPKVVEGELVDETIEEGEAPVINDANLPEWYEQARKMVQKHSKETGDPTKTQKIMAECGITNLRQGTNEQLYNLAVRMGEELNIDPMKKLS